MRVAGIVALCVICTLAVVSQIVVVALRRHPPSPKTTETPSRTWRFASRGACERPGLDIHVPPFLSSLVVALLAVFYFLCFFQMLDDIAAYNRGEPLQYWQLWGPVLAASPLVLILFLRGTGRSTRPVYLTAGALGFVLLLMDVGGLTITRFILWPVWTPTVVLYLLNRIWSAPDRIREERASGRREPLFHKYRDKVEHR